MATIKYKGTDNQWKELDRVVLDGVGPQVVGTTGDSETSVMSQKAVTTLMQKKLIPGANITIDEDGTISSIGGGGGGDVDIRQTSGYSSSAVMSQSGVTHYLSGLTTSLNGKAGTATTLAGYGITDAYTTSETSGASQINTALSGKQETLVSGTNIKTLSGQTLLGSGNITMKTVGGQSIFGTGDIPVGGGVNIVQTTGSSSASVMSQKAVTTLMQKKLIPGANITIDEDGTISSIGGGGGGDVDIRQTSGYSSSAVMSQSGVTHYLSGLTTSLNGKAGTATTLAGYGITDAYTTSETSGASQINTALNSKAGTATTLAGYGITDAYTKSETSGASQINTALSGKAGTATTLAGYGITNAYTKDEVDDALGDYLPISGGTLTGNLAVNGSASATSISAGSFSTNSSITAGSFIKTGSTNDYVLLGSGGTTPLSGLQERLVNQVNIKSINGHSLLGSGNIDVSGGGGGGGGDDYLPIDGGVLKGSLTLSGGSTPANIYMYGEYDNDGNATIGVDSSGLYISAVDTTRETMQLNAPQVDISANQVDVVGNMELGNDLNINGDLTVFGSSNFVGNVSASSVTASSFVKSGSTNDYVLLGSGGTKALSAITSGCATTSQLGNYLPLSGGTVTGAVNLASISGNVGIGTATPASKLDVYGYISASGLRVSDDITISDSNNNYSNLRGGSLNVESSSPSINFTTNGNNSYETMITLTEDGILEFEGDGDFKFDGAVTAGTFVKSGSTNDYVLLGSGGTKALSAITSGCLKPTLSSPQTGDLLVCDGGNAWVNIPMNSLLSGYATTSQLSNYLPLSGGTVTGGLSLSGGTSQSTPTYLDIYGNSCDCGNATISVNNDGFEIDASATNAGSIHLIPGNGTVNIDGDVEIGGDFSAEYGDSTFGPVSATSFTKIGSSNNYVLLGGGGTTALTAITDGYATTSQLGNYLPLSGGTLTGDINMVNQIGTSTINMYADSQHYAQITVGEDTFSIDTYFLDPISGSINFSSKTVYATCPIHAASFIKSDSSDSYVLLGGGGTTALSAITSGCLKPTLTNLSGGDLLTYNGETHGWVNIKQNTILGGYATKSQLGNYLPLSGGTLTGNLNMGGNTLYFTNNTNGGRIYNTNNALHINNVIDDIVIGDASNLNCVRIIEAAEGGNYDLSSDTFTKRWGIGVNGVANFSGSVTASSFIKSGGTSSQFLKADGSVDSNTYLTSSALNGYATTSQLNNYLPLSGGTVSGELMVGNYHDGYFYFRNGGTVNIESSSPIIDLTNQNGYETTITLTEDGILEFEGDGDFKFDGSVSAGTFVKSGSTNDYVLLGGGGTKALSAITSGCVKPTLTNLSGGDLLTYNDETHGWVNIKQNTILGGYATKSQLGNYLPLSGGTLTGGLALSGSSSAAAIDIYGRPNYNDGYATIGVSNSALTISAYDTRTETINLNASYVNFSDNADITGDLTVGGYCAFDNVSVDGAVTAGTFVKSGSTDSYVLLGGGGTTALSAITSGFLKPTLSSPQTGDLLVCDGGNAWVNIPMNSLLSGYATTSQLSNYLPLSGGTVTGATTISAATTIIGNGSDITLNTSAGTISSHGKLKIGTYVDLSGIPTLPNTIQDYEMWVDNEGYVRRRGYNGANTGQTPIIECKRTSFKIESGRPVGSMYIVKAMDNSTVIKVTKATGEALYDAGDAVTQRDFIEIEAWSSMFIKVGITSWAYFACGA